MAGKNPVEVVAEGLHKAFDFLKGAAEKLVNLGEKIAVVIKREKEIKPQFVGGIKLLVEDVSALIGEAELVVNEKGLVLAEDSKAFLAFKKLVVDAKEFAPVVHEAVENLK